MAAKFIVALACVALCQSTPLLINGVMYREGRNLPSDPANRPDIVDIQFPPSQGFVEVYPGNAIGQAEAYEIPVNNAAVASAHNGPYFPIPPPATVVSYQNFEVPAGVGHVMPTSAQSSASVNDHHESAISSASTQGTGSAQSAARSQGIGNYGVTSNANTHGSGFSSASSTANNGHESTVTSAKIQGNGLSYASSKTHSVQGISSADSQVIGDYGTASSSIKDAAGESIVTSANTQGYGSSSANANVHNSRGTGVTKTSSNKGIKWQFGTLYGTPYDVARAHAESQAGPGIAKSSAQSHGIGSAQSTVNSVGHAANANSYVNGLGYANSAVKSHGPGHGSVMSTVNGIGSATSTATDGINTAYSVANTDAHGSPNTATNVLSQMGYGAAQLIPNVHGVGYVQSVANSQGYGTTNSAASTQGAYGPVKSTADVNGAGFAQSVANDGYGSANSFVNSGHGSAKSSANVNRLGYGSVNSNANINGAGYAKSSANSNELGHGSAISFVNGNGSSSANLFSHGPGYGSRTIANAHSSGSGHAMASAKAQGVHTAFRVVNSSANTNGLGTAAANAQSL